MPKSYISKEKKQLVFSRAKYRCEYCQCRSDVALASFEVEHIIPQILNGDSSIINLALSCRGCNSYKTNKIEAIDPLTNKKTLLYHPRKDQWKQHFTWIGNFQKVKGLTPTGRATILKIKHKYLY